MTRNWHYIKEYKVYRTCDGHIINDSLHQFLDARREVVSGWIVVASSIIKVTEIIIENVITAKLAFPPM